MTESSAPDPSTVAPSAPATAADVMQSAMTTVEPNDHAAAAAYLMKHAGTTALVVVNDKDARRPAGLVTEADIVQAVADGKDVNVVRVQDLMTARPTVVPAATSIRDAARTMIAGHFRHLPVVDDTGIIGMLDIGEVCGALLGPA